MKNVILLLLAAAVAFLVGSQLLPNQVAEEKVPVAIDSRIGIPLIDNGIAYFGSDAGTFYAMKMSTGEELWRLETPRALLLRPALHRGTLYFGGEEGVLYAVDAKSGNQRWTFQAGQVDWQVRDIFINGTPTIVGNSIYFSSEDFNVYALDLNSGIERWRFKLDEEPQALELPIVEGIAYIGAWDGFLYAIDVSNGQLVWKSDTDSDHMGRTIRDPEHHLTWVPDVPGGETLSNQAPYVTTVPIIEGDSIYFSDWSGNLMAVDRATGIQKWRFKPETANLRHAGSRLYIVHYEDEIFYSTMEDKRLFSVDKRTGTQVWMKETEGWLFGPIPAEENVALYAELILDADGNPEAFLVHALDMNSKEVLWTNDNVSSLPFVQNGVVYFGGQDGTLHGIDLFSGEAVWKLGL